MPKESNLLEQHDREVVAVYRDEEYLVRDNGAVFRLGREGKRKRRLDGVWTFGMPSTICGYMMISTHRVHQIVATAFLGVAPSKQHVVDHIDTNRQNNRPENLRWVTRLENILMNPITAKRVKYHYGSIENFLASPGNPRIGALDRDFEWMRTVTPAEAEYSLKRLLAWAESDKPSRGGALGDWIFGRHVDHGEKKGEVLVPSKTPGAVQRNWLVPAEFPISPQSNGEVSLEAYFDDLEVDTVFAITRFGHTKVVQTAMSTKGTELFILGVQGGEAVKPWFIARVTHENGKFVHESRGSFFTAEGAEKQFTLIRGMPWEGNDSMDDYC